MSRRHVIHLPGMSHKAPIPAGVHIGDFLFSSAIGGRDPETGDYPPDAADQARFAFANVVALVEAAGGTAADIAHVTVYLRDRDDRKYVDEQWLRLFPDPEDRPARHAVSLDRAGAALLQLEIIAVLDGTVPDGAVPEGEAAA